MFANKTIVLIGGTSLLAKALTDQYLLNNNQTKIVIAAANKQKFESMYSNYDDKNLEFFEMDTLNLEDIDRLISHLKLAEEKCTIFYLAAVKSDLNSNIKRVFQINFFASVYVYEQMIKNLTDFNYILIGSQGDLHGTKRSPLYNASKSAMSLYFEPICLANRSTKKVYLVKPWLFKSKMIKQSGLSNLICFSTEYVAREIIKQIERNNYLIYTPKITYKLVQIMNFLSKKLLYLTIFKLMK